MPPNEAQTRALQIDPQLRAAGWKLNDRSQVLKDGVASGYLPAQMGTGSLADALKQLLPAIGSWLAGPLAEALRRTPEPSEPVPGIILIPTGILALLPLHAAVYSVKGKTRCLLDEFAVAYAPSARVLAYSRDALGRNAQGAPKFLGVSNPASNAIPPLSFAAMEVDEIAAGFKDRSTVLTGEQASRAAVEQALGTAAYLHFACHGQFRMDDPLRSAVFLAGASELTVADLLAAGHLSGVRLAVLSACQSAITDFTQLPDEFVGLPAGFLQAGAASVIGSLWPVDDVSTALLMIELYRRHLAPSGQALNPAQALRAAQIWLRDVTAAELSELFAAYKLTAPDAPYPRMAYVIAAEQFVNFTLNSADPDECPFAGAYNWAAFCCYGS